MVDAAVRVRVGVDEGRGQPRDGVDELVLGVDPDLMRLHRRGLGIDDDLALGPQMVADPTQPYLPDVQYPGRGIPAVGVTI